MKLQLLLSCMHQTDASIINRSKIESDCIIVNQCNDNSIVEMQMLNSCGNFFNVKMINTTERGLSKSRNMALKYATGDICLLLDDDEIMENNYENKIIEAYEKNPDSDVIAFKVLCSSPPKQYKEYQYRLGRFTSAGISSWQISFKLSKVKESNVLFDEDMGSGTNNGSGEESKFMYQLIKCGLSAIYTPILIGSVLQQQSQWFYGYDKKYFVDRGWMSRRIYGLFYGYLYLWYHNIRRYKTYKKYISFFKIITYTHIGFFIKK